MVQPYLLLCGIFKTPCRSEALMWDSKPHQARQKCLFLHYVTNGQKRSFNPIFDHKALQVKGTTCSYSPLTLLAFFLGPIQTREEARHPSASPRAGHILTRPLTALTQPSSSSRHSHPSSACRQHSQVLLPPWAPCHGPSRQPRCGHRCH